MDLGLADKIVLVTGAGQGLGRAIGLAFAAERAHVAFHYHSSSDGAESAAKEARALGVKSLAVGADLRSEREVAAGVERVGRELGPIDVLVNNAAATQRKLFLETTPADWAAQVDVTVKGTLLITHAVVGLMAPRRSGASSSPPPPAPRRSGSPNRSRASSRAPVSAPTASRSRWSRRIGSTPTRVARTTSA